MKRPLVRLAVLVVITTLVGLGVRELVESGYEQPAPKETAQAEQQTYTPDLLHQVLADYTGKVVRLSLDRIVQDFEALNTAAQAAQKDPGDESLAKAAQAWRTARAAWKRGRAFEFGPAAQYEFDRQISSWPLDRILVNHVIDQVADGELSVDERYLREKLHTTQRGFHVAEYLLFRDGEPRKAKDVTPAELQYLAAVTKAMLVEGVDYKAAWVGTDNLPAGQQAMLKQAGLKTRKPYAQELANPGTPASRYASPSVPLQEILQDATAVAEETCPVIADSLGSANPLDSDTWYSRNAVADVQNELKSVENAYLGGLEGQRGASLSDLLAKKSSVLDRRIKIALADAAYRVAAIGDPYGQTVEDYELKVRIAEAACGKLASRLAAATPLVSMDPSTHPWAAYVSK